MTSTRVTSAKEDAEIRQAARANVSAFMGGIVRRNAGANQDNRGARMGSRPARCMKKHVDRPSGPGAKEICQQDDLKQKFFSRSAQTSICDPAISCPVPCTQT